MLPDHSNKLDCLQFVQNSDIRNIDHADISPYSCKKKNKKNNSPTKNIDLYFMKAKITIGTLILSLPLFTTGIFAQPDTSSYNHKKWSIAVTINSTEAQIGDPEKASWGYIPANFNNFSDKKNKSLSFSVIPKYQLKKDFLVRFEIGITQFNILTYYSSQTSTSNSEYLTIDLSMKQNVYRFLPGIQWSFIRKKHIESYCGMTAVYLAYNTLDYTNRTEHRELPSNKLISTIDEKSTTTGGFASGVGAFAGFNIYLKNYLSIGSEISSHLLYYKIGGPFGGIGIYQTLPNAPITEVTYYKTSSYKGVQFSKILPSLTASFWF